MPANAAKAVILVNAEKSNMRSLFLLMLCLTAASAKRTFNGDQVLKVYPKTEAHVEFLKDISEDFENVDFWKPLYAPQIKINTDVDVHFSAKFVKQIKRKLSSMGLFYSVEVEDVQTLFDEEMRDNEKRRQNSRALGYNYNVYHTWDEIDAWVSDIVSEYPSLASSEVIGSSSQGKPIHLITVTGQADASKIFVVDCGFHAREWISHAFCQRLTYDLLRYYNVFNDVTNMLNNIQFKIVPVFNPDGYEYSWTDDRMWRKTRSGPEGLENCYGTDPNRNFAAGWGQKGSSTNACSNVYQGAYVESAPETTAYSNWIRDHSSSIKGYLTVHSYGQFIIIPYSYTTTNNYPANFDTLSDFANQIEASIESVYGTPYENGNGADAFYPASGGSDDMAKLEGVPLSYTIELRPDKSVVGFQLPAAQISDICDETFEGAVTMATYAYQNY